MLRSILRLSGLPRATGRASASSVDQRIKTLETALLSMIQTQQGQTARGAVQAAAALTRVDQDGKPIPEELFTELYEFSARQPARRQTIQRLCVIDNPADLRQQAIFISREILIRLARGASELAHAPFGFAQMDSIKRLRHFHELSYVEMSRHQQLDFGNAENIVRMCQTLQRIYQRHHVTCDLICSGISQFVQRNQLDNVHLSDLQSSLDDYAVFQKYMETVLSERVKIRFHINHFVECSRMVLPEMDAVAKAWEVEKTTWSDQHVAPRFVGLEASTFVGSVCRATNMHTVAQLAIENAKQAMSVGGDARVPPVTLTLHGDPHVPFLFPPRQAFNVITSLVAEAMRNEMRRAAQEMRVHNNKMNPVEVLVSQSKGNSDAVVRIRDQGFGLPRSDLDRVQTCLYSVRANQARDSVELRGWMKSSIRLPYATTLAQVFGGDISVASVDGAGSTVCFCAPTSGLPERLI